MSDNNANLKRECPAEDLLLDYRFGELSASENEALNEHLSDCQICSLTLSQFNEIESGLALVRDDVRNHALPGGVPPFAKRDARGPIDFIRSWGFKTAFASFAGVVLILSALLLGSIGFEGTEVAVKTDQPINRPTIIAGSPSSDQERPSLEETEGRRTSESNVGDEVRLAELGSEPEDGIMLTDILSEVE